MPSFEIDINFNVNSEGLTDAESELQNLQSTADDTGSSADEMGNSLDNVNGSSLEDTGASAESLSKDLDDASSSANDLGNNLDIIEGSMLLAVGQQFSQMGTGAEDMAQQMDTASISVGQLATMTGMAEPQMVSLINNISNATFPNDEAMMYVKNLSQMGVESQNFGKSATDIDRINDAFGLGANTTNSMATELGVLGVDMNNVSSSFNALAYANANTKGGMENFYSFLKKYDAEFNELGYDIDQSAIIISAATQKYGGGRAALSGLSEALKEADGDTRKLEEALGIQAGTLDNASSVTGEYEGELMELANQEADHKTILQQIGAAWEDVSLSLSPVLSPLGSAIGLLGQVGSVGMSVMGLRSLAQGMREMTMAINIMRNAESLSAGVKAVLSAAFGVETAAQEGNTVAKSSAIIPTEALAIAENSLLLPILLVVGAIILLIGVLWYLYNNNETVRQSINWLIAQFQLFIGKIMQVGQVIVSFVSGAISNFLRWATSGGQSATNLVNSIYNTLVSLPSKVQSAISGITDILTKPFTDAWNTIEKELNKIGDGLNQLNPTSWFSGAEYEGFNSISYEGFNSNALNGKIASSSGSSSSYNPTFNINGIIEEEASQYIVNSVNDYVKKQNLIRGV